MAFVGQMKGRASADPALADSPLVRLPPLRQVPLSPTMTSPGPDGPRQAPLIETLRGFGASARSIRRDASDLSFHFLVGSLDAVLGMKIHQIVQISRQELGSLQEFWHRSIADLSERESKLTGDAIALYVSMSRFAAQLSLFIRSSSPFPDGNLPDLAAAPPTPTAISAMKSIADDRDNVFCRICEEVVPLALVEEHSTLCVAAHQGEFRCFCADEKLTACETEMATELLDCPFELPAVAVPGVVFPVLYVYLLVDAAIGVKSTDAHAAEQLESFCNGIKFFTPPNGVRPALLTEIAQAMQEKLLVIRDMLRTFGELRKTTRSRRLSLTGLNTHLSDFEFIERISAGAFGRVYLARKKSTQALVAVKAIRRSEVNLKNLVRIVSDECDIMMKLNSPFMVHFCMFLL
jgi:hypothetical protein